MCKVRSGLVSLSLVAVVAACSTEPSDEVRKESVRPVKLLTLEKAHTSQERRFPAVVAAAKSSIFSFQVSGQLRELPVTEAQEVEKGALLAKLDQRDLRSNLTAARAEHESAAADYQRAMRLAKGDAISTKDVESRKSRRDTTRAQLDAAEKALGDSVLVAPYAGVIAKIHATKLQNIQAQQEIVTLLATADLEATVDLPATVVARSRSTGNAQAFVVFDVAPSVRTPAQFREAALEADPTTQTYAVTFGFQPPDDLVILPGMNATLVLETAPTAAETARASAGVAVPLSAVQSEGDNHYVWVIDPESMTASKRRVALAAGVGESVIATEGLSPGETIATAGAAYLADGMNVRPWTE